MTYINSGTSTYPNAYDLNYSGSTMAWVADQLLNANTGNIISSGNQIIGVQVNTAYNAINNIETTLGLNPQSNYSNVAARLTAIQNASGSNTYVQVSGSSMTGNLTMLSGASISVDNILSPTGLSWVGTSSFLLNNTGSVTVNGQSILLSTSGSAVIDVGNQLNVGNVTGSGLNFVTISSGSTIFSNNILPSGLINIGASTNPINNLYVNNIPNLVTIASGSFFPFSGGTISGNTTFNNASILSTQSGSNNIGSAADPFNNIFVTTANFTNISGATNVNVYPNLVLASGINITPKISGVSNLGSAVDPFNNLYVNSIVTSGQTIVSSQYVQISGSSINGNLNLASGVGILNTISGVNNLGSQVDPFATVWTNSINGKSSVSFKFNELLTNTSGVTYTFANSPSGAVVADIATVGGVTNVMRYLIPTTDYTISGNTLVVVSGTFTVSGSLYSPLYTH